MWSARNTNRPTPRCPGPAKIWYNTRVPAPISGRIGRSQVTEGALVGKGEATLLATIEQIDKLYANFTQSESDILRLRQAVKAGSLKHSDSTKVELVLEDGSVYPLPGKFLFADMAVDSGTGSVSLRAEIPNPKRELLPGMFVASASRRRWRTTPSACRNAQCRRIPQGQFVMLVDAEGKVAPRPVKTGSMAGGRFRDRVRPAGRRTGHRQRSAESATRARGQTRALVVPL